MQRLFFFFFFLGGRDIHYKDAMKETTSVCEGHPQQKLQATRTTMQRLVHTKVSSIGAVMVGSNEG